MTVGSVVHSVPLNANPASDFEYTKSGGEVTITTFKNEDIEGTVVVPSTIDDLSVMCIGNGEEDDEIRGASQGYKRLTSVTLPRLRFRKARRPRI